VPAKLSWKIRSASARTPVYAVKAEAVEGGLRSLEGVMRGPLNGNMKIEFGTFTEGNARSYAFTRNFGSSLQKATVLIRLPLTVKHPLLIMKSKRRMEGKKIAGDKDTADYSFGIDSLDPFTVIDGNHE
jgi:hypothetical protein